MRLLSATAATPIRFAYPVGWDVRLLSALTLTICDDTGAELLSDEDVTIPDPIALELDVSRYSPTITIDPDDGTLGVGAPIRLIGASGEDQVTVSGYDAVTGVAGIDRVTNHAYAAGDLLYLGAVTAEVDLSDFVLGSQVTLLWEPTGSGAPLTELARIEQYIQIDVSAFAEDFRALYPRAFDALRTPADRFGIVLRAAQERLRLQLLARGCDIARVRDSAILSPALRVLVATSWTANGDDTLKYERQMLAQEYSSVFAELCDLPIWDDHDDDLSSDDTETGDHSVDFERSW